MPLAGGSWPRWPTRPGGAAGRWCRRRCSRPGRCPTGWSRRRRSRRPAGSPASWRGAGRSARPPTPPRPCSPTPPPTTSPAARPPLCWSGGDAELAAGHRSFDDLVAGLDDGTFVGLPESARDRWAAAAALHRAYLAELAAAGLSDPQHARRSALRDGTIRSPGHVVLAGVADPARQLRAMLATVPGPVDVLVYAPPSLADAFDADGALRPAAWVDRPIDLSGADLRTVHRTADQATAAFTVLARAGRVRSDAVTIAVADGQLVPYVETAAARLDGVAVRYAGGQPLARTRPFRLLTTAVGFFDASRFGPFAALVRHTDARRFVGRAIDAAGRPWRDWPTLLDRHAARSLADAHRTPAAWGPPPANPAHDRDDRDDRDDLAWLYAAVRDLIGPLADGTPRPPGEWAAPAVDLLRRAYGADNLDLSAPADHAVHAACHCLRDAFEELAAHGDAAPTTAADAVRAALSLVAADRVPPPPATGDAVELVGWLELLGDDADHVVVVGFNDGLVPEAVAGDAFLTDSVRRRLGLACDDDRAARDAYVLACRGPGRVTLIGGRASPSGDPLRPSRLLFATDAVTAARRARAAMAEPAPQPPLAGRATAGGRGGFAVGLKLPVPPPPSPIVTLAVTSFGDYLRSPAGFYLKHVLKLRTVPADVPRELDARQCGELVHEAVRRFVGTPAETSTSRQQCGEQFVAGLDAVLAERFGHDLTAAARFQVEMLRRRLMRLREWQADWAAGGWQIRHAEWHPAAGSSLLVDGVPMAIAGRVDRIDHNARTGEWARTR